MTLCCKSQISTLQKPPNTMFCHWFTIPSSSFFGSNSQEGPCSHNLPLLFRNNLTKQKVCTLSFYRHSLYILKLKTTHTKPKPKRRNISSLHCNKGRCPTCATQRMEPVKPSYMDAGIMVHLATKYHRGVSEEGVSLEVWQPLRLTLFQASSSSLIQGTPGVSSICLTLWLECKPQTWGG